MGFVKYYASEILRYGGEEEYILAKAREKKPLIDKVIKYSKNGKILEAGSGTSVNSIYLSRLGYKVTCADNDEEMISLARKIAKSDQIKFLNVDILNLDLEDRVDVVFSHGVLEHFSDEEIRKIINKELDLGDYLIFSIPSNFFNASDAINGDERFLSRNKWRKIINRSEGEIVEEFSYFYDPNKFKVILLKYLHEISRGIFPFKKPYIGFVLMRK